MRNQRVSKSDATVYTDGMTCSFPARRMASRNLVATSDDTLFLSPETKRACGRHPAQVPTA